MGWYKVKTHHFQYTIFIFETFENRIVCGWLKTATFENVLSIILMWNKKKIYSNKKITLTLLACLCFSLDNISNNLMAIYCICIEPTCTCMVTGQFCQPLSLRSQQSISSSLRLAYYCNTPVIVWVVTQHFYQPLSALSQYCSPS